jgi:multidrug efflux system membrane fusion protein
LNLTARFRSVTSLFVIVVTLSLAACAEKKEPPKARPPAPVTVGTVSQADVPVRLTAVGNVESVNSVAIKAQINGNVSQVHFREGQDVAKGQTLYTIDTRPFLAALKQAEANLARDLAQAKNAEEQARRYEGLIKDGIVTREQYDTLKASADAYAASVAADRAAVENARVQLSYCHITSPIAGRVGSLIANLGTMVKANDTPAMVIINQTAPIYVTFSVPEKELLTIKREMAAGKLALQAAIPNDPRGPVAGEVTFVDNAVDMTTGTIRLKGTFANTDGRLWPGQFVTVSLILATLKNAAVAPASAIQSGQQGQYVFVVKQDATAELRPVKATISFDGGTVVESGLKPGETVVTDGQMRVMPGGKVEVKKPGEKSPGPAAVVSPAPDRAKKP